MSIKKIVMTFISIPVLAFCADQADIQIYITTPNVNLGEIGAYFNANHQSYPLLPAIIKYNAIEYPIFSEKEAFEVLNNGFTITKELQKETFIALPITLKTPKTKSGLTISLSEENYDTFRLLPKYDNSSKVVVKLFVIDFNSGKLPHPIKELKPGKKYTLKDVENKSLFLFIPKTKMNKNKYINMNHYYLPLEVHYHSP